MIVLVNLKPLCPCVYCAVGLEVIGHYDVSDTHSEQEQQLHTHSGQWIVLDELNADTFPFNALENI